MRKVILGLAVSLDGFIEGPNGELLTGALQTRIYGTSDFFSRMDSETIKKQNQEKIFGYFGEYLSPLPF